MENNSKPDLVCIKIEPDRCVEGVTRFHILNAD